MPPSPHAYAITFSCPMLSHMLCPAVNGSAARRHSDVGDAIAFSPAAHAEALETAPVCIASYTVPQHATLRRIHFLRVLSKPSFPSLSVPSNSTVYSSCSLSLSLYASLPRGSFLMTNATLLAKHDHRMDSL